MCKMLAVDDIHGIGIEVKFILTHAGYSVLTAGVSCRLLNQRDFL